MHGCTGFVLHEESRHGRLGTILRGLSLPGQGFAGPVASADRIHDLPEDLNRRAMLDPRPTRGISEVWVHRGVLGQELSDQTVH